MSEEEIRADERRQIADYLRRVAVGGQESELVAVALIDYSELVRDGAYL